MPKKKKSKTKFSKNELFSRGWTQSLIEELLPAPVKRRYQRYHKSTPDLLWNRADVIEAEKTDAFQALIEIMNKKKSEAYSNWFDRLEAKLDVARSHPKVLDELNEIDSECRRALDDVTKLSRLISKGSESYKDISALTGKFRRLLSQIRIAYIGKFNDLYDYDMELHDRLRDRKVSVQDLVFSGVVNHTIPDHPKNEYTFARAIKRHFVIHSGDTNTGKTYHALEALKGKRSGVYLAPLRLLALQVYQYLNEEGFPCTLLTGEEEILTPGARFISSTIEKLSVDDEYDIAVIDEAQMISDGQRGSAWTKAVLGARANEVHICCSPDAVDIIILLIEECGDTHESVLYERDVPLVVDDRPFYFPGGVEDGDALIAFSKRMVLGIASILADNGIRASVIYGNLPPETRKRQVEMFFSKETDVVVATDAIGMGLNLPIKRIVFMEATKFDGVTRRRLNAAEVKQISGRAGRKNIYDIGFVNSIVDKHRIDAMFRKRLKALDKAFYLPLDRYILSMPIGTLHERLIAAMTKVSKVAPFMQADIEQPLMLLKIINNEKHELSMGEQLELIFIPFDINDRILLQQWIDYLRAFIGSSEVALPELRASSDINSLETYYKQLDLHYAFCNTMGMLFDNDEVNRLKRETSARIHELLISEMRNMGSKCKKCGNPLQWDFPYKICEECYTGGRPESK